MSDTTEKLTGALLETRGLSPEVAAARILKRLAAQGLAVVPIEATEEMLRAGRDKMEGITSIYERRRLACNSYKAMIKAAQEAGT